MKKAYYSSSHPLDPHRVMIRSSPMSPSSPMMISPNSDSQARKQLLIVKEGSAAEKDRKARIGEVAGGTAAECAAVCCCCPCGLVSLLVLAVVRLPAGLCRQAIRRRRRKKKRKKAMVASAAGVGSTDDDESVTHRRVLIDSGGVDSAPSMSAPEEDAEIEKEMRAWFYGTGFWRSPSQRE